MSLHFVLEVLNNHSRFLKEDSDANGVDSSANTNGEHCGSLQSACGNGALKLYNSESQQAMKKRYRIAFGDVYRDWLAQKAVAFTVSVYSSQAVFYRTFGRIVA